MKGALIMKVLVTGFEPFAPWQRNPSGETAHHLDGATIVDVEEIFRPPTNFVLASSGGQK
jgi:pyrrolidone-carboxylate peptidase